MGCRGVQLRRETGLAFASQLTSHRVELSFWLAVLPPAIGKQDMRLRGKALVLSMHQGLQFCTESHGLV
jgi:hypothetical protein